ATPGTHPCPRRIISHRSRQDGQPKAHRWIEAKPHCDALSLNSGFLATLYHLPSGLGRQVIERSG
ncbi:hypothetical protein, partial [Pseudarthrobacter sp. NPDC092202]|uniref:hypothetical protein n=1 Tax=Pseudarthrobacter sp. NPDC092202 TaxID=3364412 RepID=UPI00381CC2F1